MILVGLTGGIGSGKSTVARVFKELGAYLIDFDALSREVVYPYSKGWNAIVNHFGREVLNEDSTLNRQKLGAIVFNDSEKREALNGIIHPLAFEEADRGLESIEESDPDAIIIEEIPLLIEIGDQESFDKVVVVSVSEEKQLERLVSAGCRPEEAKGRINAQLPIKEKIKFADFVIDNNGSIEETRKQVESVFRQLKI